MKELILTNWRTSLLAVSILAALLMFTQGKISATEFLGILGFFNVAGYLLARDAAAPDGPALAPPPVGSSAYLVREVAYWVLGLVLCALVGLSFWPLVRDAVRPAQEFGRPAQELPSPAAEVRPLSLPPDHD